MFYHSAGLIQTENNGSPCPDIGGLVCKGVTVVGNNVSSVACGVNPGLKNYHPPACGVFQI